MYNTTTVYDALDAAAKVLIRCFIIGLMVLGFAFLVILFSEPFAHGVFSNFYPITKESFDLMRLCAVVLIKVFVFIFFLIPYIAIRITLHQYKTMEP